MSQLCKVHWQRHLVHSLAPTFSWTPFKFSMFGSAERSWHAVGIVKPIEILVPAICAKIVVLLKTKYKATQNVLCKTAALIVPCTIPLQHLYHTKAQLKFQEHYRQSRVVSIKCYLSLEKVCRQKLHVQSTSSQKKIIMPNKKNHIQTWLLLLSSIQASP